MQHPKLEIGELIYSFATRYVELEKVNEDADI